MREARFYRKLKNSTVQCFACHRKCVIDEDESGQCKVRVNEDGKLFSTVYGFAPGIHIDPIEKKPIYHFLPGTSSLSIGAYGCNFECSYCQNHSLSQIHKSDPESLVQMSYHPGEIVKKAIENNCPSISYTYSEPTVWAEYTLDTIEIARKHNLRNIYVSNGYQSGELVAELIPKLDAINIDLKSYSDDFYSRYANATLEPVLENIRKFHDSGVLVEVTTLVIPDLNDSTEELSRIANFLASINPSIPWHISRFFPSWRMLDKNPTPYNTLLKAYEIGKEFGLDNVYLGNVTEAEKSSTYCPSCGEIVIKRDKYNVEILYTDEVRCPECNAGLNIRL
ncbi:MAG: AmmeMemoRadiSam system radical SAM enzyme [bacterium]